MAQIFRGRVRDTSVTTGTGSIAVSGSAITTYRTFSAVMATNDTIWAAIVNRAANEWEIGLYTYSASNTLARVAGSVLDGSSGPGVLVNFSAGTKDVFGIGPLSTTAFSANVVAKAGDTMTGGLNITGGNYPDLSLGLIMGKPGGLLRWAIDFGDTTFTLQRFDNAGNYLAPAAISINRSNSYTTFGGTIVTNESVSVDVPGTTNPASIQVSSGAGCYIIGKRAGAGRWKMWLGDNGAETGGNAGSDFYIERYGDAGFLGYSLIIRRATGDLEVGGNVILPADPTQPLHAATKQYIDTASGLKLNLAGGTMTGAIVLPAGLVTATSLNFGTPGTGIYSVNGATRLDVATQGVNRLTVSVGGVTSSVIYQAPAGSAAAPTYTFAGSITNGMWRSGTNQVSISTNGIETMRWNADNTITALSTISATGFIGGTGAFTTLSASGTVSGAGITALLAPYALLASPVLTGTPAAPTATVGTNTTQVATTAFVTAAITASAVPVPATVAPIMDSVAAVGVATKFAREDHVHPTDTSRASLASPALTGTPLAPTAGVGTNTTQVATTAFVLANAATVAPLMDGTAAVGVATKHAREDHVHSADTSRVAKAGDTMTGGLTIAPAGVAAIILNKNASGVSSSIYGQKGGAYRWSMDFGDSTAESTGNVGSRFVLARFSDAGAFIDAPLYIAREDGKAHFALDLFADTGLRVGVQAYKPAGGPFADSSDARIKNVLGDYTNGLQAIRQLTPRVYTYKGNDVPVDAAADAAPVAAGEPNPHSPHYSVVGKQFIGLIAQETETAFPEMITRTASQIDGVAVTDMRTLDSTALIYALVNAVKELAQRVETLEAK